MAVMGKEVWAVVCGAIRQEFELYTTIAMLCDYRSEGLLEGIVISTWKGEIDNIPSLRQKLETLDIYTVELDPLEENIESFIHKNYVRQAYQLKGGFDFIPEDIFVLRCRTDYTIEKINQTKNILLGKVDMSLGSHGALKTGLSYRIAVMRYMVDLPFWLVDSCFLGYKPDMYKMINFEMTTKRYGSIIFPDVSFFINLFFHQFPIFAQFYTYFNDDLMNSPLNFSLNLRNYLSKANKAQREEFALPAILNKFYALYFVLLYNCFYSFNNARKSEKISSFDFADIFTCDPKIGMMPDLGIAFANTETLRMIVEGECLPTKGYVNLYREICKIAYEGYAEKMCFGKKECDEFSDWIKNVLTLDPNKFVRHKQISFIKKNKDIKFTQALDLLFDRYLTNTERKSDLFDIIYNIAYDSTKWAYGIMEENLEKLKIINSDISENVLGPACRTESPRIMKMAAKALYYSQVKKENVESTCYIFDRWGGVPLHFYKFPMPADKVAAFYYYGKYAEPLGKSAVPKTFYNRLIQTFGLSPLPTPESYSDAVLETIKKIVSLRYKEYKENLSVKYMIDFLADEFYDAAFTQEQWDILAEYIIDRRYALPFKEAAPDAFEKLLAGAETAQSELEAGIILKLLLREKWNQPAEIQEKADIAVANLTEKYPAQISGFVNANCINENEILLFNPSEIDSADDFVLLTRILSEKKRLADNKEVLLQMYGEDSFRRTVIELFLQLEEHDSVKFFSMKNGAEIWINYTDFLNSEINSEFVMQRNNDWWRWPWANSASPSPFAAFLLLKPGGLFISIEFSSCQCAAKTKLLDSIDKTKVNVFDKAARIIRLKTAVYSFTSVDEIGGAVDKALKDFCDVGVMLLKNLE